MRVNGWWRREAMVRTARSTLTAIAFAAGLCACDRGDDTGGSAAQAPPDRSGVSLMDTRRLVSADTEPGNWMTHGRSYDEQRFSPLDQIHADNVGELGLAWFYDLDTTRGQEATPLVIDGRMYLTSAWSKVFALDAASGRLLWQYDPGVPGETGGKACCDVVNRGLAAWGGKLYLGSLDGRLIALDAESGREVWSVVTVDQSLPYTITGAPRVIRGKVIIGNGGAEFGVRGYVSAYDAESGDLAWRFYTVPGPPDRKDGAASDPVYEKFARATWSGEWWKLGGGGTVWDSIAYDPELDLLYVGVGNGSPWNHSVRSPGGGDNLFLTSILALRPDTGEYVWHYQTTPGESWDYTATQHMILADLTVNGEPRKVIMQAPKNGFFYVLDRATGKLLSAEPYVRVNWASHVDLETGRPVITPAAYYDRTGEVFLATPGPFGGHNWHPMSFNPRTGLVYVPAQELEFPYVNDPDFQAKEIAPNLAVDLSAASLPQDARTKAEVFASLKGRLLAWDPVTQKEVWRVEHAGPWNGGVLSTAGNLVFQGTAGGFVAAYRADTGEKLWSFDAQTGVVAPPVSYAVNGRQYVSVVVGWGGVFPLVAGELAHKSGLQHNRSRVLSFALGRTAQLPPAAAATVVWSPPPEPFGSTEVLSRGHPLYQRFCGSCHGDAAVSGGVLPDLRRSPTLASRETWNAIVLDGARASRGMVGFRADLSEDDAEAVRAYIVQRANGGYEEATASRAE